MFDWLEAALDDSAQVVTASSRLARALRAEYSRRMLAAGKTAWRSPAILSWQDWLTARLAESSARETLPILITAQQSRLLWERCLRREVTDPLLNIGMLARQSRDTWNRLRDWGVPLRDCQRKARNRDQRLFAKAAAGYESILRRENWEDEAGLANLVAEEIRAKRVVLAGNLTLAGFDRVTPQQQRLAETVRQSGFAVVAAPHGMPASELRLHKAENPDAELRAAGSWARQQLLQSADRTIAIVVTQLEQNAQRSLRLVREGLMPGWQNAPPAAVKLVNVSYGRKLVEHPAIDIALLVLRWLHSDLATVEVSRLLQTILIGAATNDDLARMELHLRQQPNQMWTPQTLLVAMSSWPGMVSRPAAEQRVRVIAARRDQLPARQSPTAWVEMFMAILQELQWPGAAPLDSVEFQLVNRWRELLNDVARLELVSGSMTAAEALARIATIASETVYQPESDVALVQVLGPLEAAGMRFDNLWVTGLSNRSWPPPARPLSLLSRDLQRDAGMPDATPDDTLAYANRVLHRLTTSAEDIVLSYSTTQDDVQQTASELLQDFSVSTLQVTDDPGWNARRHCAANRILLQVADPVPTVKESEVIAGGAATLQRQLLDPFAAFAVGRLGVRVMRPIVAGLSASIRGSLIHAALQKLYAEHPSRDQIRAWESVTAQTRIRQAVDGAFRAQERNADHVLRHLLHLEKARAEKLLAAVIELDAARPDFRIFSVEQKLAVKIAGVNLHLRLDRVDHCTNGEPLIIDYKTGAQKTLLDRDKNPRDMQLVVYTCAMQEPVGGIALFNVDSRAVALDGAGRELSPELDWDMTLGAWQAQVESAARQMAAGDVRINRQQSGQSARPFALLSRFQELLHER